MLKSNNFSKLILIFVANSHFALNVDCRTHFSNFVEYVINTVKIHNSTSKNKYKIKFFNGNSSNNSNNNKCSKNNS